MTSIAIFVIALMTDDRLDASLAVVLGMLALLAEQFPISIPFSSSYSITFVVTIAAMIAGGPGEAVIVAAAGSVSFLDPEIRNRPAIRHIFNSAQMVATTGLAALTFFALSGSIGNLRDLMPGALLPLLAAAGVDFIVNTGLVATIISLVDGVPISSVWRTHSKPLLPGYLAFAGLGLLLAALYMQMGWGSVVFLLVPLLVARKAFQTSVRMQGAFDSTVKSLIAAIEAKDPYTRGHAERVARLAELTAREYGFPHDRARQVAYAALVHDVGKLVVQTRVLRKQGRLTPDEYEHMKSHPVSGLEIVAEIDLLSDVLDGIRHHHERMDGRGYPDGLVGRRIPVSARLISVADAFDSMTSTRTYRAPKTTQEALAEMRRYVGMQFDPVALDALERALTKHGWEAVPESESIAAQPKSISLIEEAVIRRPDGRKPNHTGPVKRRPRDAHAHP